jgi:hypothetical protein
VLLRCRKDDAGVEFWATGKVKYPVYGRSPKS